MRLVTLLAACTLAACGGESVPVPPPSVQDLAGLEARVAASKGRPLILNFWATW